MTLNAEQFVYNWEILKVSSESPTSHIVDINIFYLKEDMIHSIMM